ncbi:MAG: ATP-binding protein [Acidobacteriaceae bacterium]
MPGYTLSLERPPFFGCHYASTTQLCHESTAFPSHLLNPQHRHFHFPGEKSGLGLAIAERILRLHGGRICATNADGGGLSVEIILPRMPRTEEEG